MDVLKLTILAFIAGGIVLYMANVSTVHAILISGLVTLIVTVIAVIRYKANPPPRQEDETRKGPRIR